MEWDFILGIALAFLMGSALGIERQIHRHPAGLRTNALVCVGAALFVSLSQLMDHDASPTRIAAQVVSGIGFLGAGVILREGMNVRGMTTAATLWCSAGLGTLAGAGFWSESLAGTGIILAANLGLRPVSRWIDTHAKGIVDAETTCRIKVVCPDRQEVVIRELLTRHLAAYRTMFVQAVSSGDAEVEGTTEVQADLYSTNRDDQAVERLISRLTLEPGVASVRWERVSQLAS
jgi:putative Mg2+ transporter-C (MgtC) family protein